MASSTANGGFGSIVRDGATPIVHAKPGTAITPKPVTQPAPPNIYGALDPAQKAGQDAYMQKGWASLNPVDRAKYTDYNHYASVTFGVAPPPALNVGPGGATGTPPAYQPLNAYPGTVVPSVPGVSDISMGFTTPNASQAAAGAPTSAVAAPNMSKPAADYLDPSQYVTSKPGVADVPMLPGQAGFANTPGAPAVMDPWTEAQKSAQLTYDMKARSIADYIKGQAGAAGLAADWAGGAANRQMNDQGLLSSTAAGKVAADYTTRATQPYLANISGAQSELSNLGNDTAAQAALNYQNLGRTQQGTTDAYNQWLYGQQTGQQQYSDALGRSDYNTNIANQQWTTQTNQALRAYQDALDRGDQATAMTIWQTLMSFGMGKGAVTGEAKDYSSAKLPTSLSTIYAQKYPTGDPPEAGTGPIGDPPAKSSISKYMEPVFKKGTKTLAQKQMAQSDSQFSQQLALERDKYNTAVEQYNAEKAAGTADPWKTDPWAAATDFVMKNYPANQPIDIENYLKTKGLDLFALARTGTPEERMKAKALIALMDVNSFSGQRSISSQLDLPKQHTPSSVSTPWMDNSSSPWAGINSATQSPAAMFTPLGAFAQGASELIDNSAGKPPTSWLGQQMRNTSNALAPIGPSISRFFGMK